MKESTKAKKAIRTQVNEMRLAFPARSVNERAARSAVAAFISVLDPTLSELSDVKCAVSEAVTNCIVHAYRDTPGKGDIYINVRIFNDHTVKITVRDKGCGIENVEEAKTPLYTTDPEGERSGMGFAVMESFTDKLTVLSKVGKGTTVKMEKRLGVEPDEIKKTDGKS